MLSTSQWILFKNFFTFLIRLYQKIISPLLGHNCRFYPSCSQYFIEALEKYGAWKGFWKGFWRILRCGPWSCGGIDEV